MAIFILTDKPQQLLDNIKSTIDNGHIRTWEYDSDGDFTHSPIQWKDKAWLRPFIQVDKLTFGIIYPKDSLTILNYAVYHGRFLEMILTHFDRQFTYVNTSALLVSPDQLKG